MQRQFFSSAFLMTEVSGPIEGAGMPILDLPVQDPYWCQSTRALSVGYARRPATTAFTKKGMKELGFIALLELFPGLGGDGGDLACSPISSTE